MLGNPKKYEILDIIRKGGEMVSSEAKLLIEVKCEHVWVGGPCPK